MTQKSIIRICTQESSMTLNCLLLRRQQWARNQSQDIREERQVRPFCGELEYFFHSFIHHSANIIYFCPIYAMQLCQKLRDTNDHGCGPGWYTVGNSGLEIKWRVRLEIKIWVSSVWRGVVTLNLGEIPVTIHWETLFMRGWERELMPVKQKEKKYEKENGREAWDVEGEDSFNLQGSSCQSQLCCVRFVRVIGFGERRSLVTLLCEGLL